ncbi:MAG: ribosome silencing factor [Acidobacteriota bacterium]|nr:ribosome silencing factor [Acidobacteriota bacterium]
MAGSSGFWALSAEINSPPHKAILIFIRYNYSTIFCRRRFLDQIDFREEISCPVAAPLTPAPSSASWLTAVRAAESKQATEIKVLNLTGVTSFTDFFVICTGSNSRQVQAISDEIGMQLKKVGELPISLEGYQQAEWILADYGDFLIHVFSPKARDFYDLERLWRNAKDVPIPPAE